MDKKGIGIVVIVVLFAAIFVLTDKEHNISKAVAFAVSEEQYSVEGYNELEFESYGEKYSLVVADVNPNRQSADFIFKSESGDVWVSFTLDMLYSQRLRTYKEAESVNVKTKLSKIIGMNDREDFYIELLGIKHQKAEILIKKISK